MKSLVMQNSFSKKICVDLNNLFSDPKLWENISFFHLNYRDEIRVIYLQRGSCQRLGHNFP